MFKTIIAATTLLFLVTSAQADGPTLLIQMRDAVYANDLEKVEVLITENQTLFERGERTAEDMRQLFGVFDTTNPKAADLAAKWVEAKPQSPYANAAMAWVLSNRGWNIRGEELARDTYPEALRIFRDIHKRARHHAEIAYEIEPRLIAASDAIISSANGTGNRKHALEVVDAVMQVDPNNRTLNLARGLTSPGWGGSWDMVENLCESYAALPPEPGPKPVLSCKLRATYYYVDKRDWMRETLAKEDLPDLDYLRIRRTLWGGASKEEAKFAQKYGYDFIGHEHALREYEYAKTAIEHDPYKPELLEVLVDPVIKSVAASGGRIKAQRLIEPTKEEMLDYAQRLIHSVAL